MPQSTAVDAFVLDASTSRVHVPLDSYAVSATGEGQTLDISMAAVSVCAAPP